MTFVGNKDARHNLPFAMKNIHRKSVNDVSNNGFKDLLSKNLDSEKNNNNGY